MSTAFQLHRDGNLPTALAGMAERIRFFAGDEETAAELRDPSRNWYAKPGHKYFLYQYELHLLGGAAPLYGFEHFTRGEFRASTTEHVLPQTPTSRCWRVFSAKDGITGADGKVTHCYRSSTLKQEQELATFEEWTPERVQQRQNTSRFRSKQAGRGTAQTENSRL